jgi:hypothetical protein
MSVDYGTTAHGGKAVLRVMGGYEMASAKA